jgi:rhamnose utilization protein RhaD (predicted bifunctional aldolase and dehydrogenase)/NAD(P)-dependent dehydrogenase (short-subunit alcohol dehydrogenase family)
MNPQNGAPETLEQQMRELVELSRFYGSRGDMVLAGGGNTSLKTENRLFVKASGTVLASIEALGFVELDRLLLEKILEGDFGEDTHVREEKFKSEILRARIEPEKNQRPSVECLIHHLIEARHVVHTHCTLVNMVTCAIDGKKIAGELFGEELLWLPYVDPGYVLAKELYACLADYHARTGRSYPPVILMENHGLIISGDTAESIHEKTEEVLDRIRNHMANLPPATDPCMTKAFNKEDSWKWIGIIAPTLRAIPANGSRLRFVQFDNGPEVMSLVCRPDGESLAAGGPLIPDHSVYCESFPCWLGIDPEGTEDDVIDTVQAGISAWISQYKHAPRIILVEGLGLFAAGDGPDGARTARLVYTDLIQVMNGAMKLGGIQYMKGRARKFIETWEVEEYRKKIAATGRVDGRVDDRIAIVTGAAQGFGLEIARHMVEQGACVVLTDINENGARDEADRLNAKFGQDQALGLSMDVTDDVSIAQAIHDVVCAYGGLDVFISNAGVVKAGSVKDQPVDEFDSVMNINYRGYFLCTQHVAPIMARQHRVNPEWMGDIIQINSKSGLAGSNRNAAYAGSKFGGIGLTQSFALELVEDGIKVNSICPGNFLDGPLWSDRGKGLFVQYLGSGKIPGARNIKDVRKYYESKVPMRRGCRTLDIMQAIYYVIDQKYETGQAIPVTGGQVMLH